jgi:hypothetical protein
MKKQLQRLSATLLLAALAMTTYAQSEVKAEGVNGREFISTSTPESELKAKTDYQNWRFPVDAVANLTSLDRFVNFLYQDSTVVFVQDDGEQFFQQWQSVGAVFTPNDPNLELEGDNISLSRYNEYTVDSIYFPYLYVRYNDSVMMDGNMTEVVDTLIVQFFKADQLETGGFTPTGGEREIFMKPSNWTPARQGSNNPAFEVRLPLRGEDSTERPSAEGWGSRGRVIPLPAGFDIASDAQQVDLQFTNAFGFSISYKSMLPNNLGDTMEARNGATVTNRVNYFGHSFFSNSSIEVTQTEYINNSWWVPSEISYGGTQNGWSNSIPGNAYFDDRYLNYAINFSTTSLGTEELEDIITYGVYPNPISANQTLKADFNLVNASDVVIEMYDILGNKVKEIVNGYYTAGEHRIDANITNISPGMYIYSVKVGDATSTKKISVVK